MQTRYALRIKRHDQPGRISGAIFAPLSHADTVLKGSGLCLNVIGALVEHPINKPEGLGFDS